MNIRKFARLHGSSPTRAEIAKGLGFASGNAAEWFVQALARKGAITIERDKARGIRLAEGFDPPATVSLGEAARQALDHMEHWRRDGIDDHAITLLRSALGEGP